MTFPNLASVHAQQATVAANHPGVEILGFYTPSGDSGDHPDEWGTDTIHPLLPWYQRVAIPRGKAAVAPYVS